MFYYYLAKIFEHVNVTIFRSVEIETWPFFACSHKIVKCRFAWPIAVGATQVHRRRPTAAAAAASLLLTADGNKLARLVRVLKCRRLPMVGADHRDHHLRIPIGIVQIHLRHEIIFAIFFYETAIFVKRCQWCPRLTGSLTGSSVDCLRFPSLL